ncbi:hypothetical protein BH11PSE11_BH11PSE11_08810 [soil metagenome]
MKMYLASVVIAVGAVIVIVNLCVFHASASRAVPTAVIHFW